MAFVVPLETLVDDKGVTWKGYFRVDKGRAGGLIVREFTGKSKTMIAAGNRLVLKLASGHPLTPHELIGLKLLQGILMMSTTRPSSQRMGCREFNEAIKQYLELGVTKKEMADPEAQKKALRDWGIK